VKTEESSLYRAFLLRCWQEEGTEWRFRLQNVQTGEQRGFTDLETMLEFLQGVFEVDEPNKGKNER
jgi:hypothetical protein